MSPNATLIIGPGGCGKTHRLGELGDSHDGPVVWVRATSLEQSTELGALRALLGAPAATHHDAADLLAAELGDDTLFLVDDAHLLDESSVAAIGALLGRGPSIVVAHRPSERADLAALDDTLRAHGSDERVGVLDEEGLGTLVAEVTSRAVDSDALAALHESTGGVAAWAVALVGAEPDEVADAGEVLTDSVAAELTRAGVEATSVAHVVALAPELPDDVLAAAVDAAASDVRRAFDSLAAGGLLDPEGGVLWPCVRTATRALLSSAARRELHERLAGAVLARGGEVADAADHLLQSGATGPEAAALYVQAGDEVRFRDPDSAIDWYGEASSAGHVPGAGFAGSVEAEAYAGRPIAHLAAPADLTPSERLRVVAVRAVDEAREGRSDRAADLFDVVAEADSSHPALGVDAARLLSRTLRDAATPLTSAASAPDSEPTHDPLDPVAELAHRLARACESHTSDPSASAVLFIDAADALERLDAAVVMPDSPHALGVLHLAASGDLAGAEILAERAVRTEAGGPVLRARHRLLEGWLHLRGGRYELPVSLVREPPDHPDGRDRLVLASIVAGLARRNGDIARLREAWATAEPLLLAGVGDLHHVEVVGELVLAAARLGQLERTEPTLDRFASLVAGPVRTSWSVPYAWLEVQIAVETNDADAADAAAVRLREQAADRAQDQALAAAADGWRTIVADEEAGPDRLEEVERAAAGLSERGIPWEASRLVGQAAIRANDAGVARRLLEQARQLHRSAEGPESTAISDAGLSERELEIARYVVDGLTHKEIGAQLYISPKTVEHHVARIRRKVQAGSRAEMLAVLRDLVPPLGGTTGR